MCLGVLQFRWHFPKVETASETTMKGGFQDVSSKHILVTGILYIYIYR